MEQNHIESNFKTFNIDISFFAAIVLFITIFFGIPYILNTQAENDARLDKLRYDHEMELRVAELELLGIPNTYSTKLPYYKVEPINMREILVDDTLKMNAEHFHQYMYDDLNGDLNIEDYQIKE